MTEEKKPSSKKDILKTIILVGLIVVSFSVAVGLFADYLNFSSSWNDFPAGVLDHYYPLGYGDWGEGCPDGWISQREGVTSSQVFGGQIYFAMCDHDYLGPLHGFWNITENVVFEVDGWYNLRIENNVIVEVELTAEFTRVEMPNEKQNERI